MTKKFIYLVVIIAAAVVILVFMNTGEPAAAPTISGLAPTSTVAAGTSTAPASAASMPKSAYFDERTSTVLGAYLTDANGMALYTFTRDTAGKSNCTGACLTKWPPYGPGINASGTVNLPMLPANVSTIKGNNGMIQFTWKGMPLYYYFGDKAPGDTNGEGLLNAWYVVKL